MNVLLDECVPHGFKASISSDTLRCMTAAECGFAGKRNGELLELAEKGFDVFITLDKVLPTRKIWLDAGSPSYSFELNRIG
jgi:hypothetical protein